MYEQHLKRIESNFGKLEGYDSADTGDKCVILLRQNNCNYAQIQAWMGNPSKKWIRKVLLKWAPELIDLDCNYNKLKPKSNKSIEKQLINYLNNLSSWNNIETQYDIYDFEIKDGELWITSDLTGTSKFIDWDETTQKQILNSIWK